MPSETFEQDQLGARRFAPVAIPKRVHAPEAAQRVSDRVSGIIAAKAQQASVQRMPLTPDESLNYVFDVHGQVVGAWRELYASDDGTRIGSNDGREWDIISKAGAIVETVDFGEAARPGLFWYGMATFERGGKIGFFTDKGVVVADAKFDNAKPFDGAYALVKLGGMWGAIDRDGRQVVACAHMDEDAVSIMLDRKRAA